MDSSSRNALARLLNDHRVASLGTLFHGTPLVSLVPYSRAPESPGFDIHVSRLAQHTQGLLTSKHVGLMIAEADREGRNPQTIGRLSIQGVAEVLDTDHPDHSTAREAYLQRFPNAAVNFELGDFLLVRVIPHSARLVTGFGKIFDLTAEDLRESS